MVIKWVKFILCSIVLALAVSAAKAQTVTFPGSVNSIPVQQGGIGSNRWLILPDTLMPELTSTLIRHYGLLAWRLSDSSLVGFDGVSWRKLAYSDDVPVVDSSIYVTVTRLDDTAAAIRADIPDVSGLVSSVTAYLPLSSSGGTTPNITLDTTTYIPTKPFLLNNYFKNGGNAFGSRPIIGTTDNYGLQVNVNNTKTITIDSIGRVAIGDETPLAGSGVFYKHQFNVVNNNSSNTDLLGYFTVGDAPVGSNNVHWYRAGGTLASPTATTAGSFFESNGYRGHTGVNWTASKAAFQCYTPSLWTAASNETEFHFGVTPVNTTTRNEALTIKGDGAIQVTNNFSLTPYRTISKFVLDGVGYSSTTFQQLIQSGTSNAAGILFGESTTNEGYFIRYGSALAGNYTGTSIAQANTFRWSNGNSNQLTTVRAGGTHYNITGSTATNYGTKLTSTGLYVDQIQNLHSGAATKPLHVVGAGLFTDSVVSNTVMREAGITSAILKTTANGTHQAAVAGTDYENALTFSTGLTRSTNTITNNVSTGVSGGQTINGGTAANDDLTIEGTTHATKTTSYVNLQTTGGNVGIGTTTPGAILHVAGTPNGSVARFDNSANGGAAFFTKGATSIGLFGAEAIWQGSGSSTEFAIGSYTASGIRFHVNNSTNTALYLTSSENVEFRGKFTRYGNAVPAANQILVGDGTDMELVGISTAVTATIAYGNATLSSGTIAVANTAVTANSVVVCQYKTASGTQGFLSYTLNAGVGFTINSSSGTDNSVVSYSVRY